ncbi:MULTISPECIES: hypothetical protein [Hyphomonas]|uniref:SMI1/KNR4 family protein n=1 Tax=Hyphomonas adhaerens TaxID=81029 RepID=A0A3B9GXU6_9PROT|nr:MULTISPECIES: hypothetical protein [Hyphomonas]MBB40577.1 hypothetical protein [Hyphomonas sp.]HAE27250.1 hypothetical protein [Hyphomonas adhaerens]|tara:strand:- start:1412 stop:2068 length:657 start_codon:yes stop_codon:yes gene_type:complete
MSFRELMTSTLPHGMQMPIEFSMLFDWMDENGCVGSTERGDSFGVLDPSFLSEKGGSAAYFHQPFADHFWTGCGDEQEMSRLSTFMKTGWDGSSAAFWLDDAGQQHIVHLGSGSGSIMIGVWTKSPLDLLKLLAIGYVDLCWPDEYEMTPLEVHNRNPDAPLAKVPMRYRNWLQSKFGVEIPTRANELVGSMSKMGEPSDDLFAKWLVDIERRGLTGQ